jgi:hypothetical protein
MARATRSKPKPKEPTPEPIVSTIKPLPATTSNPPKLFVLPKDTSKDARIVTLDDPANGSPSRYYFCPTKGFYEFTRITAPKKECRSWLITGEKSEHVDTKEETEGRIGSGYINKSADMFVATSIDLLFLILPALAPKSAKDTKQHFLAFDDYLDKLSTSSRHWRALLSQYPTLKSMVEKRMRALCDTVDAGDETMFRISHDKLLAILLKKAERMVAHSLPPSMEERFIKTALEIPIMSIRREESSLSGTANEGSQTSAVESQLSIDTTISTPDAEDTPSKPTTTTPDEEITPVKPALTTPQEVPHLLRLRTSLNYLTSSYLPSTLQIITSSLLKTSSTHDFTSLDAHLAAIASLKSEAAALRSISDNISRKRAMDDDEATAGREEKKRKKEEDDKKKKMEGRAVKQLKKVDTSGMKKMSSFFMKVEKKKA